MSTATITHQPGTPWPLPEAAKYLNISYSTLRKFVKLSNGSIPVVKFGRLVKMPDAVVKQLAAAGFPPTE